MPEIENRKIKIHPNIIFDIINRQAGTLSKALLEGVMNSIDAGATKCDIILKNDYYKIADNGKGFVSKKEIEDFFETFGTPHEEGEGGKQFGRFRIGRGQLMAFSEVTYTTGNFQMIVDIKNKGLDYIFKDNMPNQPGCIVEGKLYEKFETYEINEIINEFKDYVAYAPIPITLNENKINKLPSEVKWDKETDEAYFKFKQGGDLKIYNMGVLVNSSHPSYIPSPPGIVTSKNALMVNFARNAVLTSACPIWKKIKKTLKESVNTEFNKKTRITYEDIIRIINELITGKTTLDQLDDKSHKIIKTADNQYGNIMDMLRLITGYGDVYGKHNLTVSDSYTNIIAEKIHKNKIAYVITPLTLEQFKCENVKEFVKKIKLILDNTEPDYYTAIKNKFSKIEIVDFKKLSEQFSLSCIELKESKIPKKERILFKAFNNFYNSSRIPMMIALNDIFGEKIENRRIHAGESQINMAWTDGATNIWMDIKTIKKLNNGIIGAYINIETLMHEYAHNDSSYEPTHLHDDKFNEIYRKIMEYNDGEFIGLLTKNLSLEVYRQLEKEYGKTTKNSAMVIDINNTAELHNENDPEEIENIQ
jgi:hypothetical protein